tara:strand:- start:1275 stop:1559 length:285 start_codon:yes stop_codon:yes gene_type:complete
MSEFLEKSQQLSPDMIERFRSALSQGKWPDGQPVTVSQKNILTQAIIVYDAAHTPNGERIGELEDKCASKTNNTHNDDSNDNDKSENESPIKWQ